jgi:tRNA-dihydrouridine synthase A
MTMARSWCVAPMVGYTDRHFRLLARLLSRHALLYTEMTMPQAVLKGCRAATTQDEGAVALQLAGSDPGLLAEAAAAAEHLGYGEVNLNVGCPSPRVQQGFFGACLMREPALVGRCVAAMVQATNLPVTIKTRLAVDDGTMAGMLLPLVAAVRDAGCATVIVHARNAWLAGLDPKANRTIPPLRHEDVHRLKALHPELTVILNGGLVSMEQCLEVAAGLDGIMVGRAAYHDLSLLARVDRDWFGAGLVPPLGKVLRAYVDYMRGQLEQGMPLAPMSRHLAGLFHGMPHARARRAVLGDWQRLQEMAAGLCSVPWPFEMACEAVA